MNALPRILPPALFSTAAREAVAFPHILLHSTWAILALVLSFSHVPGLAHGDVHEQIENMGKILQKDPGDHASRMIRASCYFAHGQYNEALEDLEKLPAKFSSQKGPALLRIRACLKVFRLQEADKLIADSLTGDPGNLATLRERSNLRLAQQRFAEAVADLDTIIAASANPDPDLLLDRARASARLDLTKTLAWIDTRLSTSPLVVLEDEAVALCQKAGRPKDAAERLSQMAVKAFRPEFHHGRRAKILAEAGLADEARQAWKDCLASLEKLPPHTRSQPAVSELRQAAENALKPSP